MEFLTAFLVFCFIVVRFAGCILCWHNMTLCYRQSILLANLSLAGRFKLLSYSAVIVSLLVL